LCQRVTR